MQNDHSKTPIIQLAIEFSLMVIKYAEQLETSNKHVIASQVLKSGTSIGANIMEAQSTGNKTDYFEKMKIADRKAHNTWYWLYLCDKSAGYDLNEELLKKLDKIMEALHNIIQSGEAVGFMQGAR